MLLPNENIKKNTEYPLEAGGKKNAEVDLVIIHGETALIFEAKSNRIFRPLFEKGHKDYFNKGRIRDIIKAPIEQANRFRAYFEKTPRSEISKKLNVDCLSIKNYYLIGVTLDPMANFNFNVECINDEIQEFADAIDFTILSIDDLEVIIDHCQTPEDFIDYLKW